MQRTITRRKTQPEKYQLILSADWHLRDSIPACRERKEYLDAQERKLAFVQKLCKDNNATLLIAGDIFDDWRPSPWLLSLAIHYMPPETICVCGQHDIESHSLFSLPKTGLQTLEEAGAIKVLTGGFRRVLGHSTSVFGAVYGYSYGEEAQKPPKVDKGVKILMWHRLTCHSKQPWPGAEAEPVSNMVKKFSGYDLILTGDNHQQFAGPGLINPGSLLRMSSDQSEFEPAVFGWRKDGTVTRIPLPIKKGVVKAAKSNAKAKESRDERMEAYVKKASAQFETRLSFTKNLEQHFRNNKECPGVEQVVWKAVG